LAKRRLLIYGRLKRETENSPRPKGGELVRESQLDEGEGGWSPCKKNQRPRVGVRLGFGRIQKKLGLGFFVVALNFSL